MVLVGLYSVLIGVCLTFFVTSNNIPNTYLKTTQNSIEQMPNMSLKPPQNSSIHIPKTSHKPPNNISEK